MGTAISPWLFNPLLLSASTLIHHFEKFLLWVDGTLDDSWQSWQTEHKRPVRAMSVVVRVKIFCTRLLPQRLVLLFVAMSALELPALAPTHTPRAREVRAVTLAVGVVVRRLLIF